MRAFEEDRSALQRRRIGGSTHAHSRELVEILQRRASFQAFYWGGWHQGDRALGARGAQRLFSRPGKTVRDRSERPTKRPERVKALRLRKKCL
jgi:hypothetical protein